MASANAYKHHMTIYIGIVYLNEVSFWSNAFILRIQEDASTRVVGENQSFSF